MLFSLISIALQGIFLVYAVKKITKVKAKIHTWLSSKTLNMGFTSDKRVLCTFKEFPSEKGKKMGKNNGK